MKATHQLLTIAVSLALLASSTYARDSEFGTAIEHAQKRMVKIYGAGIGRSPGYATGIIVSPDGDILTSQGVHLATDALRVTLPSGEQQFARVLHRSSNLQAAIVKVEARTPDYFELADAPTLEPGDWMLAVSNAFKVAEGTEPLSVNLGVFTMRTPLDARRGANDFPYQGDVLMFDAITSNPGAAGGAVITVDGKLAGMIGRVIEGKSTNTRLNYAVPSDLLASFLAKPEASVASNTPSPGTESAPGELGIRLFALGGRRGPAFVDRVVSGSPAALAGIKTDDLVVSIGGKAVRSADDFKKLSDAVLAGQEVIVQVKRKNDVLSFPLTATGK